MSYKRLLAAVLAVCLVVGLVPKVSQRAWADDSIVYELGDVVPEYALFNYYTGANETYFKNVMSGSNYNAVQGYGFHNIAGMSEVLDYNDTIERDSLYKWDLFYKTDIAYLWDQYEQLQMGFAITLNNNTHTHSWGFAGWYEQQVTSQMAAGLFLGNYDATGEPFTRLKTIKVQYPSLKAASTRFGNAAFYGIDEIINGDNCLYGYINSTRPQGCKWYNTLYIKFQNLDTYYDSGSKTCKCGGSASGPVVSFKDGTSPMIESVRVLKEGVPATDFAPGETITIELTCTEPIRLADNDPSGKRNVWIGLNVENSMNPLYARMASLSNSYTDWQTNYNTNSHHYADHSHVMTFEHVVTNSDVDPTTKLCTLTSLNLKVAPSDGSPLIHDSADIVLKTIKGRMKNGSMQITEFNATAPSGVGATGYTRTTSYVTDMAGNALSNSMPSIECYIDLANPQVVDAVINADTKNTDVKTALDKLGTDPNTQNYEDASDLFLGEGDTFNLAIYMSEVVYTDGPSKLCAEVRTNLLDTNGDQVVLYAKKNGDVDKKVVGDQYGLGSSKGKVSCLTTDTVTIRQGMSLMPGTGSELRVQSVVFDSFVKGGNTITPNVRDSAGNSATGSNIPLELDKHFGLDTEGGDVTGVQAVQYEGDNSDFRVEFTTEDEKSGTNRLTGSITLTAASDCSDGFEYAITASDATPTSGWEVGSINVAMSYEQSESPRYFHFRALPGMEYDLPELTANFMVVDYAGNKVTRAVALDNVSFDKAAPTGKVTDVSRTYNSEEVVDGITGAGTMTVPVNISDYTGLKTLSYLWADNGADVTEETDGWETISGFTQSDKTFTANVVVKVPREWEEDEVVISTGIFDKTLWIKGTDTLDNSGVFSLGAFKYDLHNVKYALSYPLNVVTEPYLGLSFDDNNKNDVLVIDVQKGDDPTHYFRYINSRFEGRSDILTDAINHSAVEDWYEAPEGTITVDENTGIISYGTADAPLVVFESEGYLETERRQHITTHAQRYFNGQERKVVYSYTSGSAVLFKGDLHVKVYSGTIAGIDCHVDDYLNSWGHYYDENDNLVQLSPPPLYVTIDPTSSRYSYEEFDIRVMPLTNSDDTVGFISSSIDEGVFTHPAGNPWYYYSDDDEFVNTTLEGYQISFNLTDKRDWNLDDIDWANSFITFGHDFDYAGVWSDGSDYNGVSLTTALQYKVCGIGSSPVQTITLPASDKFATGYYNQGSGFFLILARKSEPGFGYALPIRRANGAYGLIEIDDTQPGSVVPGLLRYQPLSYPRNDYFGGSQLCDDFPAQLIDYDPAKVIYVPAEAGTFDMMFQVLDADGNQAPRQSASFVNSGAYDVIAWNETIDREDLYHPYIETGGYRQYGYCFDYDEETGTFVDLGTAAADYGLHSLAFCVDQNWNHSGVNSIYGEINLLPDQDNRIGVQVRYANGRASDILYLTIHPVSLSVEGTIATTPASANDRGVSVGKLGATSVSFTPAAGQSTAGLSFYACEGLPGRDGFARDLGEAIPMVSNGTSYVASIPERDDIHYPDAADPLVRQYAVYARDRVGNLLFLGMTGGLHADSKAPEATFVSANVADGRFEATFRVTDDSLYACG
ncbi:MAG: hypothetical protein K5981_03395, partial [Clostridia bacterium]|nr:hypothetical protein [Clostridia bacterium]